MAITVPTTNTVITSAWGKSVADALNAMHAQGAFSAVTTGAAGQVHINFPIGFAAVPAAVVVNVVGQPEFAYVTGATASGFDCTLVSHTGTTPNAVARNIVWMALGARA